MSRTKEIWKKKNSISFKLLTIGIIPVILFLAFLLLFVLPTFENEIYEEKEIQTREMVNTALGVVEHYYQLVQNNELDEKEAQARAQNVIRWMTFGPGGQDYFWINDFHPRMIMHPFRPDLDGEDLSRISDPEGVYLFVEFVQVCEQEGAGYVPYHWQYYDDTTRIEPKLSYVASFEPWEWIIGTGVYINDVNESIAATRNRFLLWTLAILIVTIIPVVYIAKPIIRNVKSLTDFIVKYISKGNFGVAVPDYALKLKDEFGDLARALETTISSLREIVITIQKSAEETSSISEELSATTQETSASIEEVAASTEQFASTTQLLSQNSQSMDDSTAEVNTLAYAGQQQMDNTQQQMQDIIESAKEAGKTIKGLEKSSEEIENIAGVISSVADQTNLLALNAAIEAARAGEHGQGFAVVADEVRKLAEETQKSVGEIKEIISRLSQSTGEAVSVIDSNNQQIETGAETLKKTGESFSLIVKKIGEITSVVQDVSSSSQELSASSEEISAATEEQSSSMEEISSSAENLSAMAEELSALIANLSV